MNQAGEDATSAAGRSRAGRRRVPLWTKIVLVASAWLLLTLFLVGRFSDGTRRQASSRLDPAAGMAGLEGEEVEEGEDPAAGEPTGEDGAGGVTVGAGDEGATQGPEVNPGAGEEPLSSAGVYEGIPSGAGSGGGGEAGGQPGGDGGQRQGAPAEETRPAPGGSPAPESSTTTTAQPSGGPPTTSSAGGRTSTTTTAPPPVDRTISVNGSGNDFTYSPRDLSVPAGSRVQMTNRSTKAHTWKIRDGEPIPLPRNGTTAYQTFAAKGSFPYRCTLHAGMSGTITVT